MKHFDEILKTLGASSTELLAENPRWDFWEAEYSTPVSTVKGYYLNCKYDCKKSDATPLNTQTWKHLSNNTGYELILTPRSELLKNIEATKKSFRVDIVRTSKQLIQDTFLKSLEWKSLTEEEYFVEPTILTSDKTQHPAKTYLSNWFLNIGQSESQQTSIAVLKANGGVGKTTLSRILCAELHKRNKNVIPILIESDQWKNLIQSNFTLDSIWDLALSRRFENASKLLSNKTALQVLVREGLFVLVFDGFDELCITPNSPYAPQDLIDELTELLTPEDSTCEAKVLLTTRSTYWSSMEDDLDLTPFSILELQEFDNDQKKSYFKSRLKTQGERDAAFRISKEISGGMYEGLDGDDLNRDKMSGVPFVLDLIARYVEDNEENNDLNPYSPDTLGKLIEGICKRENIRQKLGIDPSTQVEILKEIFREYPKGISKEDLGTLIEIYTGIKTNDVIKGFTNHTLLQRFDDKYESKYEVLSVYFLARYLADELLKVSTSGSPNKTKIAKLLSQHSNGKSLLMDWVADELKQQSEKLNAAFKHAIEIVRDECNIEFNKLSEMAISQLAIKFTADLTDKNERTKALNLLISDQNDKSKISNVFYKNVFSETLRSFDFTNTKFNECTFVNVELRNCVFDNSTIFFNCIFEQELTFTNSTNANQIVIEGGSTVLSKEADYALSEIRELKGRNDLKLYFAEEALSKALRRFRTDYGFKDIQYRHRRSGFKPGNPFNESVWRILENNSIVERHKISNVDEGGLHVTQDKVLRKDIVAFLDNGVVAGKLKIAINELAIKS